VSTNTTITVDQANRKVSIGLLTKKNGGLVGLPVEDIYRSITVVSTHYRLLSTYFSIAYQSLSISWIAFLPSTVTAALKGQLWLGVDFIGAASVCHID
jgi:hypothetical protein